jgi:hypothetical protein
MVVPGISVHASNLDCSGVPEVCVLGFLGPRLAAAKENGKLSLNLHWESGSSPFADAIRAVIRGCVSCVLDVSFERELYLQRMQLINRKEVRWRTTKFD